MGSGEDWTLTIAEYGIWRGLNINDCWIWDQQNNMKLELTEERLIRWYPLILYLKGVCPRIHLGYKNNQNWIKYSIYEFCVRRHFTQKCLVAARNINSILVHPISGVESWKTLPLTADFRCRVEFRNAKVAQICFINI